MSILYNHKTRRKHWTKQHKFLFR